MGGLAGIAQLLDHVFQLIPQEYGNDRRRRLVTAKTQIVAHIGSGFS